MVPARGRKSKSGSCGSGSSACQVRAEESPLDGVRQSLDVRASDRVLFGKYSGSEIKLDGEELLIMREDEIFGVVERADAVTNSSNGKKRGK
jgi:co-chaperonin GroES (HSP10)